MSSVLPHIMKKELIQTFRDPRMLALLVMAPVLQTILFGYAVNLDLTAQPTVISDQDRTRASRESVQAIMENVSFRVIAQTRTDADAEAAVASSEASLAILIPRGFEKDLAKNKAEIMVILDGSDSNTALRAGQEASQILNSRAIDGQIQRVREAAAAQGVSPDVLLPRLQVDARAWFNPSMKTAIFLLPGVLALVLMVITTMLTAMGLTREKEIGTLEQVMVTPVRPIELMIGKTVPFALLGLLVVGVVVSIATVIFDLPLRGSMLSLYGVTGLYLMTTLGLGLFISTVSATQQQAMLNAFFVVLPALMLSGFIFPIENMPKWIQWITIVNPLRYYIQLVRGIMVKGSNLTDLWISVTALAGLGVLLLTAAASRFRKRIA